jgi:uncharacterized membrane protein YedE/YeeE
LDTLNSISGYWPWWAGALALAGIAVFHFVFERRFFGVSGSFSRLLDGGQGTRAGLWDAVFLLMVPVGAFAASWSTGTFAVSLELGPSLDRLYGAGLPTIFALLIGGVLVGFGTRLARGCTSGHGLCGTARLQPGSLLATAIFFGTGIGVAHLLEALV